MTTTTAPAAINKNNDAVDTKSDPWAPFGNDDGDVGTKHHRADKFGNDAVDTKLRGAAKFDNDTIGFIRLRKRTLKPQRWTGSPQSSTSFDLVKAIRVDGKPRHQFVLGLGSQKYPGERWRVIDFWTGAVAKMKRHGLDEAQRRALLDELVRRGAQPPTAADCEYRNRWQARHIDEIEAWLRGAP